MKVKKNTGLQIPQANIGIGYKVFKGDWKCRDFQYKVGEVFEHSGNLSVCNSGFHFCENLIDCFNYYHWDPENKVAVVHFDKTKTIKENGGDKSCTSLLYVSHEIKWEEVMVRCNHGHSNTGHRNTGHWNTGHSNTGHWNTGDRNTGFLNTDEPKMRIFNVQTELTFNECSRFRWFSVLMNVNPVTVRCWNNLSTKEQE